MTQSAIFHTEDVSRLSERPKLLISQRQQTLRKLKDHLARGLIHIGGIAVIFAITLIFAYLIYEVIPLFKKPSLTPVQTLVLSGHTQTSFSLLTDERAQVAAVMGRQGQLQFWQLQPQPLLMSEQLIAAQQMAADPELDRRFAFYDDGKLAIAEIEFKNQYDQSGALQVKPQLIKPYGEAPLLLADAGTVLQSLTFRDTSNAVWAIGQVSAQQLKVQSWKKQISPFGGQVSLRADRQLTLSPSVDAIQNVLLSGDARWLYVISPTQGMEVFDLKSNPVQLYAKVELDSGRITASQFLLGGFSLILGNEQGQIQQWMPVRDDNNHYRFSKVREFSLHQQAITELRPEYRRKGFIAADLAGYVGYFNTTAEVELFKQPLHAGPIELMALTPRGDQLWLMDGGKVQGYKIDNEHPEVSWKSLWSKIWYEGYDHAQYLWQSSASSNDFEPKFSLMPLAFGTLKASFYTMLMAIPLALCGAIFTAYFMAPTLRTKVKPTIELMAALPTVILGFLAGLWLAPLVEQQLPGIVLMLVSTPIVILLSAYLYTRLPESWRQRIPDGWQPLLLIPSIILSVVISMTLSDPMQVWFFDGDMRKWLTQDLGIGFDQRNSLVVAFAMGFAAIPVIFSIAEDAIFAVPKHLTFGSLALGATSWQTLVRVVLPTASPGIFSAMMIGFGRAVGETMIVLMATGNTPIMDMNIFEGFRTLAANIAVEMPETEVDSSHFRVLFLAALVLLSFTFVVNTTAELVRQRLREKYGSL
jgi:phosphate transport system permease protein